MTAIVDIKGREILDSRGNPTVEVDVILEDGSVGRAAVDYGITTVFMEPRQDTDKSPGEGPDMVPLRGMPALLELLVGFDRLAKEYSTPNS